jgi:gamma-glutamyltranspeptidase
MAPALIVNKHTFNVLLAAVGSGGASATGSLVSVLLRVLKAETSLDNALDHARAHPANKLRTMQVERHASPGIRAGFARRGLGVVESPALDRVNIMYCPKGMFQYPELCEVRTDRRGHGYAINAEF